MPCAVIFRNPRTPYYHIVIISSDPTHIDRLRIYAKNMCPDSAKNLWDNSEYLELKESWVSEDSVIVADQEQLKQFHHRGVAMCLTIDTYERRMNEVGSITCGIRYFSKYAFSRHAKLATLSILETETFLDETEMLTPEQLLSHYLRIIDRRKSLRLEPDDFFCLSPLSSPKNT